MKQLQLNDFFKYQFLSELSYSPDGKMAAVVATQCDEKKNAYKSYIHLYKNGQWMQLTACGKEKGYVWADDTHILFAGAREEEVQEKAKNGEVFTTYYRISTEGGEALPAMTLPYAGGLVKKLSNGQWIVGGSVDKNCPDFYLLDEEARKKIAEEKKAGEDYEILTEAPFYLNNGGFISNQRRVLYLFDEKKNTSKRITDGQYNAGSFVEEEGKLYYLLEKVTEVAYPSVSELHVYDLATGEDCVLGGEIEKEPYLMEKVGSKLMLLAQDPSPYHISDEPVFYEVDKTTGALTKLAPSVSSISNSTGSDCRFGRTHDFRTTKEAFYFLNTERNDVHLCRLDENGSITRLVTKEGSIDDFAITEDGEILITAMYDGKLQEVYSVNADGEAAQISCFNEKVLEDVYVADYQKMTIQSCGWDIDGWVLLPKDFDETKTYPAILDIHGGPRTVYSSVFYHEMQLWANMGYFVFFCNPVGGSGRGQKFADITVAYGTTDYQNIMDFTDAVLAKYPQIDPKRVGCTGGSYGGYMSNWILGHTDRFACVATQRSISNWISFYGVSDIGYFFCKNQHGFDIYSDLGLKELWDRSPLKYINNMKTPTLFIHSDEDYRCPLEQGLQLFTALKEKGVETRFVMFKGENHELSRGGKPLHRQKRLQEITDWMEKHCK